MHVIAASPWYVPAVTVDGPGSRSRRLMGSWMPDRRVVAFDLFGTDAGWNPAVSRRVSEREAPVEEDPRLATEDLCSQLASPPE